MISTAPLRGATRSALRIALRPNGTNGSCFSFKCFSFIHIIPPPLTPEQIHIDIERHLLHLVERDPRHVHDFIAVVRDKRDGGRHLEREVVAIADAVHHGGCGEVVDTRLFFNLAQRRDKGWLAILRMAFRKRPLPCVASLH